MVVEVDVRRMLKGLLDWLTEMSASEGPQSLDHPVRETLVLAVKKLDEYGLAVDSLRKAADEIASTFLVEVELLDSEQSGLVEHLEVTSRKVAQWRNVDDARSD